MFSAINRKVKRMVLRQQKARPVVRISDTTLRDGCQTPGVRLSAEDKAAIARALADAGVHSIDCGFPAASKTELEHVKAIAKAAKGPLLSAHCRTKREDIDAAMEALSGVSPFKRACSVFIGISPVHREHKHCMSKAQIIDAVTDSIEYASTQFELISFGPEDASRTEPEFLCEVFEAAIQAGAMSVGFADTVGILTPGKVYDAIRRIQDNVPSIDDAMIGVHFHNDLGLATANSLSAVKAGANMVQGTINGIGERAGNASLEEIVLTLRLHEDEFRKKVNVRTESLLALSQLVTQLTKFHPAPNKPVVGENLFRTEAGVHQDGMLKHADTYMPFPPAMVGAGPVQLVLGHNSGRKAVLHHLEAAGIEASDEHVEMVMDFLKNGAHDESDFAEIRGFLERLRPYMSVDESYFEALDEGGNEGADTEAANPDKTPITVNGRSTTGS